MADILLDNNGDICVSEFGDISLTDSIRQEVLIRLRWIHDEWRLGPDLGFTWFEDVLVKNPNIERICSLMRNEIMQVEGIKNATVRVKSYSKADRKAVFAFEYTVDEETYREEVTLNV